MSSQDIFIHPNLKDKINFTGNVVFLGFGAIAQGTLPLLLRHIDITSERITIITSDERGISVAKEYGIRHEIVTITEQNYTSILKPILKKGDFVINLSVNISTCAIIELCQSLGVFYIDTCNEPWDGYYSDKTKTNSDRSNYFLREVSYKLKGEGKSTCIVTHGANPGMISHLTKRALLTMAKDNGMDVNPKTQGEWAKLAHDLEIKVIHIAERDTQVSKTPKKVGEFVNTWSVDGFISEGLNQPAELGWGSHEKQLPPGGKFHTFGRQSAIYVDKPGMKMRVHTWVPEIGQQLGFLITHGESITISDYLTWRDEKDKLYRPTVHYAYHPCNDAILSVHEILGNGCVMQPKQRIMNEEILEGEDILGVLLMGNTKGAFWYGSILSVQDAKRLCPHNQATTLQVTSAVLGGFIWAIENPDMGVVEPEDMNHNRVLDIMEPYLGRIGGYYTDWTPVKSRIVSFEDDLDFEDPWQFKNFVEI